MSAPNRRRSLLSEEEETPSNGSTSRHSQRQPRPRERQSNTNADATSVSRRSSFHHGAPRNATVASSESRSRRQDPARLSRRLSMRLAQQMQISSEEEDEQRSTVSRRPSRHVGFEHSEGHADRRLTGVPTASRAPRHPQYDDSGETDKLSAMPSRHQSYHNGVPRSRRNRRENKELRDEKCMQFAYSANEQRIKHLEKIVHDLSRELNRHNPNGRSGHPRSSRTRQPPADGDHRDISDDITQRSKQGV